MIDFVRILQGFVFEVHARTGGAIAYYADIGHQLLIAKTVIYVTQTLIGDGVIVGSHLPIKIYLSNTQGTGLAILHNIQSKLVAWCSPHGFTVGKCWWVPNASHMVVSLFKRVPVAGYVGTYTLKHATLKDTVFDYVTIWVTVYLSLTMILNTFCTGTSHGLLELRRRG